VPEAPGIEWTLPGTLGAPSVAVLDGALDRLAGQGVTRLYVHLDVDLIDAGYAKASEFAPTGGSFQMSSSNALT
jgi:arginase family enzyme